MFVLYSAAVRLRAPPHPVLDFLDPGRRGPSSLYSSLFLFIPLYSSLFLFIQRPPALRYPPPSRPQVFACTVGQKPSRAPFYLNDPGEVLQLLARLVDVSLPQHART